MNFKIIRSHLVLLLFLGVLFGAGATARADWNPRHYHAQADGRTLDTVAFQQAIDAAHIAGGGVVHVPAGTYLIGTIDLRSGVTLDLAAGATLLGSPRIADYRRGNWPALIKAQDQQRVAITGSGTIDGQGKLVAADTLRIIQAQSFLDFFPGLKIGEKIGAGGNIGGRVQLDPWTLQREGKLGQTVVTHEVEGNITRAIEYVRPQVLEFWRCSDIHVSGVTLLNSACWVETYRACTDLTISGIKVRSASYWNNDGMDIVDCQRVRISDCDVDAADDGICLKSDDEGGRCEDIAISHCRIRSSASAFKLGTASRGTFRHIRVNDLEIRDTYRSAAALESVDGAILEDVVVDHVTARNTGNAFFLRLGSRAAGRPPGVLRHITLSHFDVEVPAGRPDTGYEFPGPVALLPSNLLPSSIVGLPGHPVEDVTLRDITIVTGGGGRRNHAEVPLSALASIPEQANHYPEFSMFGELPAWGLYFRHAAGIKVENMSVRFQHPDYRAAFVADDVRGLRLDRLKIASAGEEAPIVLHGVTDLVRENVMEPSRPVSPSAPRP